MNVLKSLNIHTKFQVSGHLAEWSLLEDGGKVHRAPVEVGSAVTAVQHQVVRRLEQAVADIIPAELNSTKGMQSFVILVFIL